MELKNSYWEISILAQAGELEPHWDDPLLVSSAHHPEDGLLDTLQGWKELSDIVRLQLSHVAGNEYAFTFTHSDARTWTQGIKLGTGVLDSQINFDVPDFWALNEIRGQRAEMLGLLIELLLAYKLESLEVNWL